MNNDNVVLLAMRRGEIEIDQQGRVWRTTKRGGLGVKMGGGYARGSRLNPCPRQRAEFRQSQGYLQVRIMFDGRVTTTMAHRMVWVNLHGSIPRGMTINHKNGIKDDNQLENMELATMSQQRIHAVYVLNVNRNHPKGSRHPKTKLYEEDVLTMRRMRASGVMVKKIAKSYEMDSRAVSSICTGRTWRHI